MSKFAKKKLDLSALTGPEADKKFPIKGRAKANDDKAAKPKAVKSKPAAKAKKETKEAGPDNRKITLIAKENPKREGSASYDRFELYKKNKTVQAFLDAGGTAGDLRHDANAGHIKVA